MNIEKLKTKRAIVDKAFNIKIDEEYVAPGYELEFTTESQISQTGLLKIFMVQSTAPDWPRFLGRWDLNEEAIDIDISNVSLRERLLFKAGRLGYKGHHTVRLDKDTRSFRLDVRLPNREIYRGELSLNVNWSLEISQQATATASIAFEVLRKTNRWWQVLLESVSHNWRKFSSTRRPSG